jgi:hypothetical protein
VRFGVRVEGGAETILLSLNIIIMPQTLDFSPVVLQAEIPKRPATVVLADLADAGSDLRERSTTTWKKNPTEHPYDFPNNYVDLPIRFNAVDPISTYAVNQNTMFTQRYFKK